MMDSRKVRVLRYLLLCAFSIFFIVPFGYAIYTSLLSKADIGHLVLPGRWTFENYQDIFVNSDVLIWYKNSIIVTLGILVGNLIVNTMALTL